MAPKVSVVMPVYNGDRYLAKAVESILTQTFTDFEFMVIDDGSTDASVEIIKSYRDPRIRFIQNTANAGVTKSLNQGLALAAGEYIARMDADDVSLQTRLAKQVAFMDAHPQVGVCGSWVEIIGTTAGDIWRYPEDPDTIQCRLLFESALAHPSVIMRRALFEKAGLCYDPSYPYAQDYELWVRAVKCFRAVNLPEVLLHHRLHPEQVGERAREGQQAWAAKVRLTQLEMLGVSPTTEELEIHQALGTWKFQSTKAFVERADAWLRRLQTANARTSVYPKPAFCRVLGERWLAVCQASEARPWRTFWSSPLSAAVPLGLWWKIAGMVLRLLSFLSRSNRARPVYR